MPWQLHIYPVFPRYALDPLAARTLNQLANKLYKRWVIGHYVLPCGAGCCLLLVAPRVFRAPEGPAAREARRPHVVRRRASKPARALRSLRRPSHQWGRVADVLLGARLEARPGPAAAQGRRSQAVRSLRRPPRLWGWVADVWLGASARCPARPRRRPRAPQPVPPVRSMCVVTNVVNRRCFSCGFSIRCYKRRQSDGFLAENGGFLA